MDLDRLKVLKTWERSHANPKARDHFFHTFNNLLLGYLVLGTIQGHVPLAPDVDHFVAGDGTVDKLHAWESLWFLTCMFHDPGYVGERFWSTVRFSYGLMDEPADADDEPIPEVVVKRILNAWDTEFAEARADLSDLYGKVSRKWLPPSLKNKVPDQFDLALKKAYYDGKMSSHSLLSGLMLIQACKSDATTPHRSYKKDVALTACEVAALSMMFHDQHCRHVLTASGIPPIAFECLPYASVLMFVDALQDDRRSIKSSRFDERGILQDIRFDHGSKTVVGEVRLRQVPVEGWPGRIAEYESVMSWIRSKSKLKFRIEYRADIGL